MSTTSSTPVHHNKGLNKERKRRVQFVDIFFLLLLSLSFFFGREYGTVLQANRVLAPCKQTDVSFDAAMGMRITERVRESLKYLQSGSNRQFTTGILKTNKDALLKMFDYGNPIDVGAGTGTEHALLLHNSKAAQNAKSPLSADSMNNVPIVLDPADATQGCDIMHTVLFKNSDNLCIAIVGEASIESHHLFRWIRTKPGVRKGPIASLPLAKSNRGTAAGDGGNRFSPIDKKALEQHRVLLEQYLNNFDVVVEELAPIAERVASEKNEIIVLTSNFGQSALLANFVCNARSKGFDLSNILVFPTDKETADLVKGMGLEFFYDEKNFGAMPSREARFYGDDIFTSMMYAKLVSVQIINHLGYNVLFQDVDVVWYKHPLSSNVFTDPSSSFADYDMLFQDDGGHSLRFAPYAANTGFYYIRYNKRTQYFFTQFLYNGALIYRTHSHQAALIQLLSEHSSLYGLKVKVLDGYEFPCGFQYHRRKDFMRSLAKKETIPYIFHMSWTTNKDNKLLFMKQMGMWYLKDVCVDKTIDKISTTGEDGVNACCSADALVSCHYRDKPSIIDCSQSDPIDKGRPSFWLKNLKY